SLTIDEGHQIELLLPIILKHTVTTALYTLSLHDALPIYFHHKIKGFGNKYLPEEMLDILYLQHSANKYVKDFSSGMKQRLKLGLAILNNSSILILDEPCSNLDEQGVEWYQKILKEHCNNRLVLIGSNNSKSEIFLCNDQINLQDFKSQRST